MKIKNINKRIKLLLLTGLILVNSNNVYANTKESKSIANTSNISDDSTDNSKAKYYVNLKEESTPIIHKVEKKLHVDHFNEPHNLYLNEQVEIMGNPEYTDRLLDVLNSLKTGLKTFMKSNNIQIILLDNDNSAENIFFEVDGYIPGNIMGIRYPLEDGNLIYVESCIHPGYYNKYPNSSKNLSEYEFNYRISRDTLLHELGHYINDMADYKRSDTEDFIKIFYNDVNNFTNTREYNIDNLQIERNIFNSEEYFATSFSCFISYPDELKLYCPETYNYFQNLMLDFEYQYLPKEKSLN